MSAKVLINHKARFIFLVLFWFLILPLPFEVGWRTFGGYELIKVGLPGRNSPSLEQDQSNAFYKTHWYFFSYIVVATLLGLLSYLVIKKLVKKIT